MTSEIDFQPLTLERAWHSIDLIEKILVGHSENLIKLNQFMLAVLIWSKEKMGADSDNFTFIISQIIEHRLIEFEKPPRNMPALRTQLEEIEGLVKYLLDAVNRLLPLLGNSPSPYKDIL